MFFLVYTIAVVDIDDANSSSQILEGYSLELKREPIRLRSFAFLYKHCNYNYG